MTFGSSMSAPSSRRSPQHRVRRRGAGTSAGALFDQLARRGDARLEAAGVRIDAPIRKTGTGTTTMAVKTDPLGSLARP
jgi:hypothetical protein